MRMRGLAALCGLVFLAGCSSVDVLAPIEDRSTTPPEVSVPVEGTEAHAVPVPSEGTFQPRHLTTEPTPQASGRTHVVVQGDTIYNISMRYGVNPRELMLLNDVQDPTQLSLGRELQIPVERDDGSQSAAPAATVTEGQAIPTEPTVETAKRPETPQQAAERKIAEQEQQREAAARGDIEILAGGRRSDRRL